MDENNVEDWWAETPDIWADIQWLKTPEGRTFIEDAEESAAEDYNDSEHGLYSNLGISGHVLRIVKSRLDYERLSRKLAEKEHILAQIKGLTMGYSVPVGNKHDDKMRLVDANDEVEAKCSFRTKSYRRKLVYGLPRTLDGKHCYKRDVHDLIQQLMGREQKKKAKTRPRKK